MDTKINFAYQGGAQNALFDGYKITGVPLIENHGNLTIQGKDKTIQWEGNFMNKENSQLIFRLDDNTNTDETILHVTGDVTFKKVAKQNLILKAPVLITSLIKILY